MDDTIKRSDVLSTISRLTVDMSTDYFSSPNYGVPHDELVDAINELESAEERTGHWIDTSPTYHHGASRNAHVCSNCHDYFTTSPEEMNYCPNCGTHMITED